MGREMDRGMDHEMDRDDDQAFVTEAWAQRTAGWLRAHGIEETPAAVQAEFLRGLGILRRGIAARGFPEIAALPTREFLAFCAEARDGA